MRSLVTGATGFLGSHLARKLADHGDEVRVLARRSSSLARLDGVMVDLVYGDVTDPGSVAAALDGVDRVFHVAALVDFGAGEARMREVNVGGTRNILGAAAEREIPAVHVSSLAAYGPSGDEVRDESWWYPGEPMAAYERTKRAAHEVARELAANGAPVRIGAPGGIYGAGDDSEMAKLIELFSRGRMPLGYLREVRQSTVQVDDCADCLVRIAERGRDGEEYLIVAECVTIGEWIEVICRSAGRQPPRVWLPTGAVRATGPVAEKVFSLFRRDPTQVLEMIELATHHTAYHGDKARRELAWSPRPLATGMREMTGAILSGR